MLGEARIHRLLETILAYSKADQTEVVLIVTSSALTRFANNGIHQNVAGRDVRVSVRTVLGKRIGVASTNQMDRRSIKNMVDRALAMTRVQAENPDFVSLPGPGPVPGVDSFVTATANCTPRMRANAVGVICKKAREFELVASGAFETSVNELAVANTLGVKVYNIGTSANISAVVMGEDSSGYADASSLNARELDGESVADEAIKKTLDGRNPKEITPGEYEVILEEYAVADIVGTMGYLGLGALAVQEDRSFMNGKFGSKIAADTISIWDNGTDPTGLPTPFDFEGVAKQRVDFIKNGTAVNVVYDSYTAFKEGKQSTGHALPAPNTYGPIPTNLFMNTGTSSISQMIQSVKKGLLVTRFHYTNPVHPTKVIVTGMTRDGTFLIENGEIARPLLNLRFTESYLEALGRVKAVGSTTKLMIGEFGAVRVPALQIEGFRFTGVTDY